MPKFTIKLLIGLGLAMLLPVASGAARSDEAPGGPFNQNLGDMDYGVCRGIGSQMLP